MIKKTKIKNPIFIKNRLYKDRRGYFKELLRENELNIKFPFKVMSFSKTLQKNYMTGI